MLPLGLEKVRSLQKKEQKRPKINGMLTFYTHLNARLCLEIKDLSLSTDLSLAAAWPALHIAGFNDFFYLHIGRPTRLILALLICGEIMDGSYLV